MKLNKGWKIFGFITMVLFLMFSILAYNAAAGVDLEETNCHIYDLDKWQVWQCEVGVKICSFLVESDGDISMQCIRN